MKILFDNYNTPKSTESTYLATALSNVGLQVAHWDRRISAFDIFDRYQPDIFVTKWDFVEEDAMKRLSGDKCKVIINTTGITENGAADLEKYLEEMKIEVMFAFYNFEKPTGFKKTKCVQIMPGADVFLPSQQNLGMKIPYALVGDNLNLEKEGVGEVYHKICLGQPLDGFDLGLHLSDLVRTSDCYQNVILMGDDPEIICGQSFFDLTIRLNGKCLVDVNKNNEKTVGEFMLQIFPELPEDAAAAKKYIRSTILRKHTAFNRAERLCKNIGMPEEVLNNLRKLQDSLINNLQKQD